MSRTSPSIPEVLNSAYSSFGNGITALRAAKPRPIGAMTLSALLTRQSISETAQGRLHKRNLRSNCSSL